MSDLRLKCNKFNLLRWGSLQRSPDPLVGGGGAGCPSPRTPPPLSAFQASGFGPLGLASPRPEFSNPIRSKILHTALFDSTAVFHRQYGLATNFCWSHSCIELATIIE